MASMPADQSDIVRAFNRFYTRRIGVLQEHLLQSEFSLTEARILYEVATRDGPTSADLRRELGLDAGYVSRVVSGFVSKGLLAKSPSKADARATCLTLTAKGRKRFQGIDSASRGEVTALLDSLSGPQRARLVGAMSTIRSVLEEGSPATYLLRGPEPGDMGWIVHRQAALYWQEYGWNAEYEALVAEIVAKFVREFDATGERCWIAEQDGKVIGSVFVVRHDAATAKLRLLYVDPSARGMGIGGRLVDECLRFARQSGYARMVLWTNSVLVDARKIYEKVGFRLVEETAHHSFGKDLVGQVWERAL